MSGHIEVSEASIVLLRPDPVHTFENQLHDTPEYKLINVMSSDPVTRSQFARTQRSQCDMA